MQKIHNNSPRFVENRIDNDVENEKKASPASMKLENKLRGILSSPPARIPENSNLKKPSKKPFTETVKKHSLREILAYIPKRDRNTIAHISKKLQDNIETTRWKPKGRQLLKEIMKESSLKISHLENAIKNCTFDSADAIAIVAAALPLFEDRPRALSLCLEALQLGNKGDGSNLSEPRAKITAFLSLIHNCGTFGFSRIECLAFIREAQKIPEISDRTEVFKAIVDHLPGLPNKNLGECVIELSAAMQTLPESNRKDVESYLKRFVRVGAKSVDPKFEFVHGREPNGISSAIINGDVARINFYLSNLNRNEPCEGGAEIISAQLVNDAQKFYSERREDAGVKISHLVKLMGVIKEFNNDGGMHEHAALVAFRDECLVWSTDEKIKSKFLELVSESSLSKDLKKSVMLPAFVPLMMSSGDFRSLYMGDLSKCGSTEREMFNEILRVFKGQWMQLALKCQDKEDVAALQGFLELIVSLLKEKVSKEQKTELLNEMRRLQGDWFIGSRIIKNTEDYNRVKLNWPKTYAKFKEVKALLRQS